jgi:hypothetical protein
MSSLAFHRATPNGTRDAMTIAMEARRGAAGAGGATATRRGYSYDVSRTSLVAGPRR